MHQICLFWRQILNSNFKFNLRGQLTPFFCGPNCFGSRTCCPNVDSPHRRSVTRVKLTSSWWHVTCQDDTHRLIAVWSVFVQTVMLYDEYDVEEDGHESQPEFQRVLYEISVGFPRNLVEISSYVPLTPFQSFVLQPSKSSWNIDKNPPVMSCTRHRHFGGKKVASGWNSPIGIGIYSNLKWISSYSCCMPIYNQPNVTGPIIWS